MTILKRAISDRDIVAYFSSGIIATDCHGIITHSNHLGERILAGGGKKLIGRDLAKSFPGFAPALKACMQSGKPLVNQFVTMADDELVLQVAPIWDGGDIAGVILNFQTTETAYFPARKVYPQTVLNEQLKAIIGASSDGIWVCDAKGNVVTINSASEVLNGIKAKDVIGKNVSELLEDGSFDQLVSTKVMESGRQETIVQHIKKTNRLLLCTGTPSRDEDGNIALIIINERDMTELENLRNKVAQSQKLTEKFKEELSELALLELAQNTIIADSNPMKNILQKALKLANVGASNILILGASGTGKGLLAKLIHKVSNRRDNPFVEINCAAIPENLLEAELFGYEKGAFSGAAEVGKIGLFELAQGGTVFLDEIGDMPLNLQTKLLKYLDDKQFRRLGGTQSIHVECKTISATNRDLPERVRNNLFREDLFYRLSSFTLEIPSLCERRDDIPGLVRFYLEKYNKKYNKNTRISSRAMAHLHNHPLTGNVRELKNIIENGVVLSEDEILDVNIAGLGKSAYQLPHALNLPTGSGQINLNEILAEVEKQLLAMAKQHCTTTRQMSAYLNICQSTVVRKLQKHGL